MVNTQQPVGGQWLKGLPGGAAGRFVPAACAGGRRGLTYCVCANGGWHCVWAAETDRHAALDNVAVQKRPFLLLPCGADRTFPDCFSSST